MMKNLVDILIIGGGINGAGIAADASSRGLSVTLVEQNDLASATSSFSSKLIHGGLRYLEYFEFSLVRKALIEREILLRKAPHIIQPLEFILPFDSSLRSKWLIRIGLFLYDYLGPRKYLRKSSTINLQNNNKSLPLKAKFTKAFSYYDCMTDDSRLVILNAMAAKENGATILTHTKFLSAKRMQDYWEVILENKAQQQQTIYAKALINAAGPWVDNVVKAATISSNKQIKLIKGSHIIVNKLYPDKHAYILQNPDKRVIFIIPFSQDFSLIGTTDVPFSGNPAKVAISDAEIDYLCKAVNYYLKNPLTRADVIWSYSGVRPLQDDAEGNNPSAITRDYTFSIDTQNNIPILNIYGGKITTFRTLASHAMAKLKKFFPHAKNIDTANLILPGGDIADANIVHYLKVQAKKYPWLPQKILHRYINSYGTRIEILLKDKCNINDLGICIAADLYEAEIRYLLDYEFATCADDILWRRTKLGLKLSASEKIKLEKFITSLKES